MNDNTKPFVVRISPELHQRLKLAAEEDDRTMAQAIRVAVKRYADQLLGAYKGEPQ